MAFIRQASKGVAGSGFVALTIAFTLLVFITVQFLTEIYAVKELGYSLTSIPLSADKNITLTLLLIPFSGALLALIACVRFLHKQPIISLITSRSKFDWKRFFISFSLWGVLITGVSFVSYLFGETFIWSFESSTFFLLLAVSITLLPLQTAVEEILFRGYIFQQLGRNFKSPLVAILGTGILFGLLHAANPEVEIIGYGIILYYLITGIFLGLIVHLDDGLEITLGYHAINNIFASLILTNTWQVFTTDALLTSTSPPPSSFEVLLSLVIVQPIFFYLLSRIFKWKNIANRLSGSQEKEDGDPI